MTDAQMTGIYHEDGPDERLRFQGALLMEDPDNHDNYLAQFNALHLKESHYWWPFPKKLFVNVTPLNGDKEQ